MIEKQMKDMAWNTFKKTGDINTFIEFMEVENMQKNKLSNIEDIQNGNYQNKGDYTFRK